jgi:Putative zinc- or iron-chelating domain
MRQSPGSVVEFMQSYAAGLRAGAVAVPCHAGCSACCRGPFVQLTPDEAQRFPAVEIDGGLWLAKKGDGSCVYLDAKGRCSIYADRPRSCRRFDCRVIALLRLRRDDLAEPLERWGDFETPTELDRDILAAVRRAVAEAGDALDEAAVFQRAAAHLASGALA